MKCNIEIVEEYNQELLDKLVKLEKEAFGRGALNKWHMAPFINHGKVFVIYDSGEPIGLAEVLRDFDNPNLAYIFSLAITSDYMNQGLGSQLLDYILQWLQKLGIKEVELTVDPENEYACYIYEEKFGFERIEIRESEYGRDEPRLVMKLSL